MVKLNKNFLKLQDNYLFSTVNRKLTEYKKKYPDKKNYKFRNWRCNKTHP